ncbi:MAG: right-handed parallel beta-helix repeat-containing protein, partial [Deltaproteobacteria bacterium]
VDVNATGAGTGQSWEDAYTTVQAAVDVSVTDDIIFVADGTYTNSPTSTSSVLTMKANVDIYGGFTGTENNFFERGVPGDNPTILDGEDTSYNVVKGTSNSRLDGFTVTGGNANDITTWPNYIGGGMWNYSVTSLLVANCTFSGNSAIYGGGISNEDNSSPVITNSNFIGNSATNDGGGMINSSYSSPTLINCAFSGNWANGCGGGMINSSYSSPKITNCTFSSNSTTISGGGIYNNNNSSPTITNCIFIGNSTDTGGGIYNSSGCLPTLINCTLVGNSAVVAGGGMSSAFLTIPTITNCIMWGDSPNEIDGLATVTYSDVEGGWSGTGNIGDLPGDNPLFVPGPNGDYYLSQTSAGQGSDSPCIDAGSDTAASLGLDDKTTRTDNVPDSGIVDMGYHYQP